MGSKGLVPISYYSDRFSLSMRDVIILQDFNSKSGGLISYVDSRS